MSRQTVLMPPAQRQEAESVGSLSLSLVPSLVSGRGNLMTESKRDDAVYTMGHSAGETEPRPQTQSRGETHDHPLPTPAPGPAPDRASQSVAFGTGSYARPMTVAIRIVRQPAASCVVARAYPLRALARRSAVRRPMSAAMPWLPRHYGSTALAAMCLEAERRARQLQRGIPRATALLLRAADAGAR